MNRPDSKSASRSSRADRRRTYIRKMEAELRRWKSQVDALRAKAEEAPEGVSIDAAEATERAREKLEATARHLKALEDAPHSKWDDARARCESSWREFSEAVEKVIPRLE